MVFGQTVIGKRPIGASVAGRLTLIQLDATMTLTPALVRKPVKPLAVAMTLTMLMKLKQFELVAAALVLGAAMNRKLFRPLAAGLILTVAMTKKKLYALAATLTLTAAMTRTKLVPLSASLVLSSAMNRKQFEPIAATLTLSPAMTRKRFVVFTAVLTFAATLQRRVSRWLPGQVVNLWPNGGAELDASGYSHDGTYSSIVSSPDFPISGTKSFKGIANNVQPYWYWAPGIRVVPGAYYVLQGKFRPQRSGSLIVQFQWRDNVGGVISQPGSAAIPVVAGQYNYFEWSDPNPAPAGAFDVRPIVYQNGAVVGDTIYWGEIQLEQAQVGHGYVDTSNGAVAGVPTSILSLLPAMLLKKFRTVAASLVLAPTMNRKQFKQIDALLSLVAAVQKRVNLWLPGLTVNLIPNGGAEVNATGWAVTSVGTMTRDNTQPIRGGWSIKFVSTGNTGNINEGVFQQTRNQLNAIAGSVFSAAADVTVLAATPIFIMMRFVYTDLSSQDFVGFSGTMQPGTQRIKVENAAVPVGKTLDRIQEMVRLSGVDNVIGSFTFFTDGWQVQPGPVATDYVETTGVIASAVTTPGILALLPAMNLRQFEPINAVLTLGAAMVRLPLKLVPASLTLTGAMTFFRRLPKTVAATLTLAPTQLRTKLIPLPVGLTLAPVMNRRLFKTMPVGLTLTGTMAAPRIKFLSLASTLTLSPTMAVMRSRSLATSLLLSPTMLRRLGLNQPVTLTLVPAFTRKQFKIEAVTLMLAPTMQRKLFITLPTTLTLSPTMTRKLSRLLAATLVWSAAMNKRLLRLLAVSLALAATLQKKMFRTFAVALNLSTAIVRRLFFSVPVQMVLNSSLTRKLVVAIDAALSLVPRFFRLINKNQDAYLTLFPVMTAFFIRGHAEVLDEISTGRIVFSESGTIPDSRGETDQGSPGRIIG